MQALRTAANVIPALCTVYFIACIISFLEISMLDFVIKLYSSSSFEFKFNNIWENCMFDDELSFLCCYPCV